METLITRALALLPRHDTSSFTPAEMAEMLRDPYEKTPKCQSGLRLPMAGPRELTNPTAPTDAKAAVGALCGIVAFFGLLRCLSIVMRTRVMQPVRRSRQYRRLVAFFRYIETSQPRAIGWCRFPTKGVILLIGLFYLFIVGEHSHVHLVLLS